MELSYGVCISGVSREFGVFLKEFIWSLYGFLEFGES